MTPTNLPRPDRWLVAPESLFLRLRAIAREDEGLIELRFDSRQVEQVSVETLFDRISTLLDGDWGHVRLILGEADGAWREGIDQELYRIVDSLAPSTVSRLRIHEHALDPAGTHATLSAPDEDVLTRWLEDRRPSKPELGGSEVTEDWVERYRGAFEQWRRAVDYHYGMDAFDWFYDDDRAVLPSI